jgi:hypothetical protein
VSEPTREEKLKTIRAANKLLENMFSQVAPDLKKYIELQDQFLATPAPWNRRPQARPEPEETPEERARMAAFLAEVKQRPAK